MNIVVANDDGIYSKGIWTLAETLTSLGTVSVVAPDREQSGVGLSITLQMPVRVYETHPWVEGIKALAVVGTPADSVLLAAQGLTPSPVDLVVSGINEGANLGHNVLVSGTVGAAFQAHFFGIPAIAISVSGVKDIQFEAAARVARILAGMFADGTLTGPMLLNVNVPNAPMDEIQGVRITRLARGRWVDTLEKLPTERHDYYWIARGRPEWEEEDGTDVWAIRRKFVSITPLHMDITAAMEAPLLEGFGETVFTALKG